MKIQNLINEADHILEQCARASDENSMNDYLKGQMKTAEKFKQLAEQIKSKE